MSTVNVFVVSWARVILVAGLLLLLGFSPAWAALDPTARDYALKLFGLCQTASQTGDPKAFTAACMADPVMTKKAFISTLEYVAENEASSPADAQSGLVFAGVLAEVLSGTGDLAPKAIMTAISNGTPRPQIDKMCLDYARPFYPQLAGTATGPGQPPAARVEAGAYGADWNRPSDFSPADWKLVRAYQTKWVRLTFSRAFSNPRLAIQEIDSAAESFAAGAPAYLRGGRPELAAQRQKEVASRESFLRSYRLSLLAEMGLTAEFESGLEAALKADPEAGSRASLLLSGFRLALQKENLTKAQSYLERARSTLGTQRVSAVLEYALRSADYQLRRARGYSPTVDQRVAEFRKSWQALQGYSPFVRVEDDLYWYYGRKATRTWLGEFSSYEEGGKAVFDVMAEQLLPWLGAMLEYELFRKGDSDDLLMQSDELTASLGTSLAMIEQLLFMAERFPEDQRRSSLGYQAMSSFEHTLGSMASLPALLGIDGLSSGFGPFDLKSGGLYCELVARIRFIGAKDPALSPEQRLKLLGESLSFFEQAGFPDLTIDYLLSAGQTYIELGHPELAVIGWRKALALATELEYLQKSREAATLLAQEYGRVGDWKQAAAYAEKAGQSLQEGAVLVSDDSARRDLARSGEEVTELSLKAAVKANDPQQALAALVRGKETQNAAAQMSGQRDAQAEVAALQQQKQEVAALTQQVKQLEAMPASATRDELLQKTQKLIANSEPEFLLKSRELRQKYPELYSRVLKFDPLDLPDVQSSLPTEAAVIEYFPTDDGLYVFLVTRDAVRLHLVDIKEKELDNAVSSFVRGIRRATPGDPKLEIESKALYSTLIGPCEEDIKGKSILVFIPTGRLNLLPFACLSSPSGEPLLESKLVLELAKPTDFLRIERNQPKPITSVVTFANATGDLPAASKEGDEIAALFPGSKLFKEQQATRQNFQDFGAKAQVLHLATHGESNSENSLTNYLRLTGDQKIAQEEIFGLGLGNTSMVTLSACNTAMGDNVDSKFVASLAEAFWLAGSQSVIASLWAVNDESTGLLMTELYSGLKAGKGKAQALRDAQQKVRSTPGYEHPYYWAGFLLFGDWR